MRLISWVGTDADRWETVMLTSSASKGFVATGFQAGVDPEPYQLNYKIDTHDGFVTRHVVAEVSGEGWHRTLLLRHDGDGSWSWRTRQTGECPLPPPGAPPELAEQLVTARDCDLGLSPLTNTMPVVRHDLHRGPGSCDIVVAWISVPDLSLHAYPQRYEHIRTHQSGATVRFIATGRDFSAELELDPDGFVESYPDLARRAKRSE